MQTYILIQISQALYEVSIMYKCCKYVGLLRVKYS
jgi:hypothetical protein